MRIIWDKKEIDISDLLKMFWECHDPTQKIDKVTILGLNIDRLYITKKKITRKSYYQVKNNIKMNLIKNMGLIETEIK